MRRDRGWVLVMILGCVVFRSPFADAQLPGAGDTISLELTAEKIENAMRILSDATGLNILLSNQATGTITAYIVDMEPERALKETIEVNGYHYVRKDDVVWVLTDEEYFKDFNLGRERRVIKLEHAHARNVVDVVNQMIAPNGEVLTYPDANVLIVAAEPDRLATVESVIKDIDVPETTRVFQLQYASAPALIQLLQAHVAAPEQMYADLRTNQISVTGTDAQLNSFEHLLREFDRPDLVVTKTIYLRYAKADVVADLLREVLTGRRTTAAAGIAGAQPSAERPEATRGPSTASPMAAGEGSRIASTFNLRGSSRAQPFPEQSGAERPSLATPGTTEARTASEGLAQPQVGEEAAGGLGPLANVTADTRTNSVIITHTESVVSRLEAIVKQLDVPNEFHRYQFLNVNPAEIDVESKLQALFTEEEPYLNVDPFSRTVTFRSGGERANEIFELLRSWDRPVRQVRIDAEILRVNVSVVQELGISWQAILDDPEDSLGALFPPSFGTNPPQGVLKVGSLSTNDYTATVRALATDNDTQTVASPKILVRDGQEAVFSSARDEPYTVVTVNGNTDTTLQDVRFLNVGTNLSVTPTINEDDLVTLDVLLEISDLVEIRDNIPVVDRSTAQSSVSVPNGGTAILGGLRQSSRAKLTNGVPVLRKIPLFGALFRNKRKDDAEFEVLLVLRPLIIQTPMEEIPDIEDRSRELSDKLREDSQDYKLLLQEHRKGE